MRLRYIYGVLTVLLAAPLAAQDRTISLVPAEQTNNITIQFDSLRAILEDFLAAQPAPMSDSVRQANFERNMEAFGALIAESNQECNTCGGGFPTTEVATSGIALFLGLIWWELRKGNKDGAAGVDGATGPAGPPGPPGPHGHHNPKSHDDQSEGR